MAKANFNDVLLKKGEKIALAVGLGLCGLFLVLGVVNMVSATSPTVKVKEFDREAKRVESAVRADGQPAADLPEWVQKPLKPSQIDTDYFNPPGAPFEPVSKPNMLRENPPVLGIVDVQMNLMTVPMKALDLDIGPDGSVRIGVLVTKRKGERDRKDVTKGVRDAFKTEWQKAQDEKKKSQTGKRRRRPNMMGMGGMPPGMPGAMPPGMGSAGMPGAMPGQAAMAPPGSVPGGGGDADTGGPGMMGGYNPYGSMMGGGMMGGGPRDDKTVKYVTPDEAARDNLELAQTVYPLRSILVNMAFPLKKQLEEIRIALRARNLQEAMMLSGYHGQYGPVFDGFEVERQIIYPDGKRTEWAVYDHEAEYWSKIYARAVAYQPDDGYLVPLIRYDQALAAPLPQLADQLGSYPELQIPAIVEVVKKMKEAGKQPVVASDWEKRFQKKPGGDRPYAIGGGGAFAQPNGMMNNGEAQFGMPGGVPGATGSSSFGPPRPGGVPGSPANGFPGVPGSPQMPPGNYPPGAGASGYPPGTGGVARMPVPGMPGATGFMQNTQLGPESEYLLMRFMDVDVQPGYGYRYRIRVKMRNPNFGQKDKVSRAAEANKEFLYGQWAEIQAPFVVPPESYLYAYDPDKYIEQAKALSEDAGRDAAAINKVMQLTPVQKGQEAVVQFQTWMPGVRIEGTKKEPVGTWVVAAMPVARGEYIGHRQLIQLPLWSAGAQNYVLRELSGSARVANVRDPKHQPKGWPVNFRIPSVLVDYTGGRVNKQVADRNIEDDAAEELLIIRADGKLLVRNSVADMRDPVREKRNKDWDDWLKRVKDRKEAETSGPPGGAPNDFGRVPMP